VAEEVSGSFSKATAEALANGIAELRRSFELHGYGPDGEARAVAFVARMQATHKALLNDEGLPRMESELTKTLAKLHASRTLSRDEAAHATPGAGWEEREIALKRTFGVKTEKMRNVHAKAWSKFVVQTEALGEESEECIRYLEAAQRVRAGFAAEMAELKSKTLAELQGLGIAAEEAPTRASFVEQMARCYQAGLQKLRNALATVLNEAKEKADATAAAKPSWALTTAHKRHVRILARARTSALTEMLREVDVLKAALKESRQREQTHALPINPAATAIHRTGSQGAVKRCDAAVPNQQTAAAAALPRTLPPVVAPGPPGPTSSGPGSAAQHRKAEPDGAGPYEINKVA
jgi:hypothetical protein